MHTHACVAMPRCSSTRLAAAGNDAPHIHTMHGAHAHARTGVRTRGSTSAEAGGAGDDLHEDIGATVAAECSDEGAGGCDVGAGRREADGRAAAAPRRGPPLLRQHVGAEAVEHQRKEVSALELQQHHCSVFRSRYAAAAAVRFTPVWHTGMQTRPCGRDACVLRWAWCWTVSSPRRARRGCEPRRP